MSDINGDDLQTPSLVAPLVFPFSFYSTFDDCLTFDNYTIKSTRSIRRQIWCNNSDSYNNWHKIEDRDELGQMQKTIGQ